MISPSSSVINAAWIRSASDPAYLRSKSPLPTRFSAPLYTRIIFESSNEDVLKANLVSKFALISPLITLLDGR